MKEKIITNGPHLKNLGICYLANLVKEEKNKHNYTTQQTFMKTHNVRQTIHQLLHNISRDVKFSSTRNWMGSINGENKLQIDDMNNKNGKV